MKKVLLMVVVLMGLFMTGCSNDPSSQIDRRSRYTSLKEINNKLISHDRVELAELDSLESLANRIKDTRVAEIGENAWDESGESYQYARIMMNIIIIRNMRQQGK